MFGMHTYIPSHVSHSNGAHKLLQNEPAEKLKTDHEFMLTEIKHGPAHCVICGKKVRVDSHIIHPLNIVFSSGVTKC